MTTKKFSLAATALTAMVSLAGAVGSNPFYGLLGDSCSDNSPYDDFGTGKTKEDSDNKIEAAKRKREMRAAKLMRNK